MKVTQKKPGRKCYLRNSRIVSKKSIKFNVELFVKNVVSQLSWSTFMGKAASSEKSRCTGINVKYFSTV